MNAYLNGVFYARPITRNDMTFKILHRTALLFVVCAVIFLVLAMPTIIYVLLTLLVFITLVVLFIILYTTLRFVHMLVTDHTTIVEYQISWTEWWMTLKVMHPDVLPPRYTDDPIPALVASAPPSALNTEPDVPQNVPANDGWQQDWHDADE